MSGITKSTPMSVQDLVTHATAGASGPAVGQQQPQQQQQRRSPAAAAPQQAAVRRRLAARRRPAAARAALTARRSGGQSTPASHQRNHSVTQQQRQQGHAGVAAATMRDAHRRLRQHDRHEQFSRGAALEAAQHSLVGERSIPLRGGSSDVTTAGAIGGALGDFAEDLTGLGEDLATAHSVIEGGQEVDAASEGAAADEAADIEAVPLSAQLQAAVQQSPAGETQEGGHAAQRRPAGNRQHASVRRGGGPTGAADAGGSRKRSGILLLGDSIDRDTLIDVRWPSSRCFDSG